MENKLITGKDIIMTGLQPWDVEIGSNFKNMALQIAQHNRVLYVNRPLDRITAIIKGQDAKTINRLQSIKKGKGVLEEVAANLWVFNPKVIIESINWLPPGKLYRFFNKRNNKKLARQIMLASKKLDFKNAILIIDNDFLNGLYLKEYLNPDCVIYYLRDYLLSQSYFYKHGVKSEPLLMQKAAIVATNSSYLATYSGEYNANSFYIGQGCEVEEFKAKPAEIPADMKGINSPVIGYCGALLGSRLDIELLVSISIKKPQWNIVLVGPEDNDFKKSKLHQLNNVYFLGHKEPATLPAYVHAFDVCINPQVINQMTIGNYPRKVDEYLAAGKPVIATATKAMEEFAGYTYLCNGLAEYLAAIEEALKNSGDTITLASRIQLAGSHTWYNSIIKLYSAINKHFNNK